MNVKDVIQVVIHYLAEEKTPMNMMLGYPAKYNKEVSKAMKLLKNFDSRKINISKALTTNKPSYYNALASNIIEKSTVKLLEDDKILPPTVDLLLEGSGDMIVTGIEVCFLATIDVIKSAVANNNNLIITHEPLYYVNTPLIADKVYQEKKKLINEHNLSVWRFHDLLHLFQPDMVVQGILKELNLEEKANYNNATNVVIEQEISKQELYYLLMQKLGAKNIRVVGSLSGNITKFGLLIGNTGGNVQINHMSRYDLPLLICGSINEWEISEYVRDANQLGFDKTLIILGHKESIACGMEYFSKWLKKCIHNIPVDYFDCNSPFEEKN